MLTAPASGELLPPRTSAVGTHRRVLEAALVAFGDRGFHGVTVREIAREAGIHVSSIYGHIPSKEMLLYDLSLLGHEEHLEQVRTSVGAAGDGVLDRVDAYVRAHVHVHIAYQLVARVSNRELRALTGSRVERINQIREEARQILIDLVQDGTDRGVFHPADAWLAAIMIIGLGLRVSEWWSPAYGYSPAQMGDLMVDTGHRILGVTH